MEVEDSDISQSHRINKAMELLHVKPSVLRELFDDQKSGRYTRVGNFFPISNFRENLIILHDIRNTLCDCISISFKDPGIVQKCSG